MYIYLDESGDLGFNEQSSKHHVVAVLATHDPTTIVNAMNRYKKKIRKLSSKRNRKPWEFKFNKASNDVKIDILNIISSKDIKIGYICVDKTHAHPNSWKNGNDFYAHVCSVLLNEFLIEISDPKISLVVDKQFNKRGRKDFNKYLRRTITDVSDGRKVLNITHVNSRQNPCLQAVDFVCGAVFRRYNKHDPEYFEIVKNKCIVTQEI